MSISSSLLRPIAIIYPKLWFKIIPEPARFMTAAGFGNIIFFYIDAIIYELLIHPLSLCNYNDLVTGQCNHIGDDLPGAILKFAYKVVSLIMPPKKILEKNKESISFFLSYLIQIFAQHFLNAFFVYGLESISSKDKYVNTLLLTYSSYLVSLIGSTICNIALLKKGMSKNLAFWGTVIGFGAFNFLVLKFLIGNQQHKTPTTDTDSDDQLNKTKNGARRNQTNNRTNNARNKNGQDNASNGWKRRTNDRNTSVRKIRGGAFLFPNNHDSSDCHHLIVTKALNKLVVGRCDHDTQLMSFIKSVKSI